MNTVKEEDEDNNGASKTVAATTSKANNHRTMSGRLSIGMECTSAVQCNLPNSFDSRRSTICCEKELDSNNGSSDDLVKMVSAHSVQSSPSSPLESEKRVTRSSFFRSSSLLRAPADIKKIKEYFKECVAPNQRLHVRMYLQGYKEIIKFLCALGTILAFASRDIESKVSRMDELISSENKKHYLFLDDLLRFEIESGVVNRQGVELVRTHKGKRFGTRIMYRLHQAMAFLVQFFINVREQPHSKMHSITNEAYKATISRNHGWLVRKTATLAFHAIPSRHTLIGRMGHDLNEKMLMDELKEIIEIATQVYILVGSIFDKHSDVALDEPKTPTERKQNKKSSKHS